MRHSLGSTSQKMLNDIRNAVIIHNPRAGRSRGRRMMQLEEARKLLAQAGIQTELQHTSGPGDASELARRAVGQGRGLVIVCGGDGTINEAVNGLARSQVPLAVLPAGTANVLAKELRLPWDVVRAAELIPQGTLRRIALGEAVLARAPQSPRYFLCVAGAGADGQLVYSVKPSLKRRAGTLAYWAEGFRQLFLYDFPKFRVKAAGREIDATLVVVGRTKNYGGPFCITTEASLFEDAFEVVAYTSRSRTRFLAHLAALSLGRLRKMRDVAFWKATSVCCEPPGAGPVYAQVDGEPIGRLPVEFRIVPDALTLVIPPGANPAPAAIESQ